MNTEEDLEEQQKKDIALILKYLSLIREHFDSVQIFTTRHLNDTLGTAKIDMGSGDWFARYGMVRRWCDAQEINKHEGDD